MSSELTKLTRYIPDAIWKVLVTACAGRCCFPGCTTDLLTGQNDDRNNRQFFIGEICHVDPFSRSGPRGQTLSRMEMINELDNLVIMCPTHHTTIDKAATQYPGEIILQWKVQHEQRMAELIRGRAPFAGSPEIKQALHWLSAKAEMTQISEEMAVHCPPHEKIVINNLDQRSQQILITGMGAASLVGNYMVHQEKMHSGFIDSIRGVFIGEYLRLKQLGTESNITFYTLYASCLSDYSDFSSHFASCCLVYYFFEKCEIMEKYHAA